MPSPNTQHQLQVPSPVQYLDLQLTHRHGKEPWISDLSHPFQCLNHLHPRLYRQVLHRFQLLLRPHSHLRCRLQDLFQLRHLIQWLLLLLPPLPPPLLLWASAQPRFRHQALHLCSYPWRHLHRLPQPLHHMCLRSSKQLIGLQCCMLICTHWLLHTLRVRLQAYLGRPPLPRQAHAVLSSPVGSPVLWARRLHSAFIAGGAAGVTLRARSTLAKRPWCPLGARRCSAELVSATAAAAPILRTRLACLRCSQEEQKVSFAPEGIAARSPLPIGFPRCVTSLNADRAIGVSRSRCEA
mmetsp:Transcript_125712/g.326442  ORF Transcript_125712/g.326442 Transcript_125712/m.326442 type:complete len:296 (-) Transcript_125712:8-895(-)